MCLYTFHGFAIGNGRRCRRPAVSMKLQKWFSPHVHPPSVIYGKGYENWPVKWQRLWSSLPRSRMVILIALRPTLEILPHQATVHTHTAVYKKLYIVTAHTQHTPSTRRAAGFFLSHCFVSVTRQRWIHHHLSSAPSKGAFLTKSGCSLERGDRDKEGVFAGPSLAN